MGRPKKRGTIYRLTNRETGNFYVGKTIHSIEQRLYHHLKMGINKFIRFDLAFYGPAVFTIEAIESDIPLGWLDRRETHWIRTLNPPYNLRKTKKKWGRQRYKESIDPETPPPRI